MKLALIGLLAGVMGCAFAIPNAEAAQFTVLYTFCQQQNCADGQYPQAGLIEVNGILYGTTLDGGANSNATCSQGCGTVFSVDPETGTESVVYSFCAQQNCTDGSTPWASLLDVNGTLYGTTNSGGGAANCQIEGGCGTVFSFVPGTSTETTRYSFCQQTSCTDGTSPGASLIDVNGTLYSTTQAGGTKNSGTMFSFNPGTGAETAVYSFCKKRDCADGHDAVASLIDVKGKLYGTTYEGGANGDGTVFVVTPATRREGVVYSFCCGNGDFPVANLIDVNGTLYGTTLAGGANGGGTLFSLNPRTRAETVLYSFCSQQNCTDGEYPYSSLVAVNGTLYGTTGYGGSSSGNGCSNTCGTVFSFNPATATETVLYSFCSQQNCTDGIHPYAGLIAANGTLYGTTEYGGNYNQCTSEGGCGTVFALTLP
jgi:uncharacterized repeat protein (TIGR03803 family)